VFYVPLELAASRSDYKVSCTLDSSRIFPKIENHSPPLALVPPVAQHLRTRRTQSLLCSGSNNSHTHTHTRTRASVRPTSRRIARIRRDSAHGHGARSRARGNIRDAQRLRRCAQPTRAGSSRRYPQHDGFDTVLDRRRFAPRCIIDWRFPSSSRRFSTLCACRPSMFIAITPLAAQVWRPHCPPQCHANLVNEIAEDACCHLCWRRRESWGMPLDAALEM